MEEKLIRHVTTSEVAVFGGTFDPFTFGHLDVVKQLLEKFRVRCVVIAPSSQNPWKEEQATPLEIRREMILAVLDAERITQIESPSETGVMVSDFAYERTYEFVREWQKRFATPIAWAIGPDVAEGLKDKKWANWEELCDSLSLLIVDERVAIHASDVRTHRSNPHPATVPLIERYGLYKSGSKL